MKVFEGHSVAEDAGAAVAEATRDWDVEPDALNLILVFCSTKQDSGEVAQALASKYPGAQIAGCTTSGEHLSGKHFNGAVVLMGIRSDDIEWSTTLIDDLQDFDERTAMAAADALFAGLQLERDRVDPSEMFCMMFIDGLSMKEERVAALLADSVEGIPILGGSAGDDLAFTETKVISGGDSKSNAAVLVMARSKHPFRIIKHQHFKTSPSSVVITKADALGRRVLEIDGLPAAHGYARALGISREELNDEVTFLNPVTFLCQNEIYVRSIQKIEDDDSIVFYCGIEEGMVLDIGGHHEIVDALNDDLASLRQEGGAELLIGCNCILRALEAGGQNKHEAVAAVWAKTSDHSIGFDTYGEQLNGLHINQTLVALAFTRQVA